MDAVVAGIGAAVATFGGGLAGIALHRVLPDRVTDGALRDMTGAVGGLLTLLTALVLGLLIWSAYGVYAGQVVAVRSLATQFLQFDAALADYGPETAAGRIHLKDDVTRMLTEIWGDDKGFIRRNYGSLNVNLHAREAYLRTLHPSDEHQKQTLAAATDSAKDIARTRLQMAVALTDPVSVPLVDIVVAWAVCIFMGFGFMHAKTLDALAALAIGAIAIATAVYLLIDLCHPYTGLFQVSPRPIQEILTLMDR